MATPGIERLPLPPRVKFSMGRLMATQGIQALSVFVMSPADMARLLTRHITGDYGTISTDADPNDREMNERSVKLGRGRVMSAYDQNGTTVWIITELSDRPGGTITTVLLPDEY